MHYYTQTRLRSELSTSLVNTLEWRDGLALILVERGANNTAVGQIDLVVGLLLPERNPVVLTPVRITPNVTTTTG